MAFQLQLRLLLWKNFTLKRRNKLVVLLELVVPLVLFFILLILRKHQPAEKEPISRFHAWPLPSSGFVALAEAFCDGGIADANGFLQYPKSKTKEFLTVLNRIAQRRGDFMSAFSPQDLSEMPEIYRNLTEDLSAAQKSATPKNFTVSSLFKDRRPIENMMENRFSTSKNETDQLLNSRLFGAQILAALLRHSSRKKASKPGLTEESCPEESSIPLGIASEDPEFLALMLSLLNPDPESVAELLVDTLLTPPRIRLLLCDNSPASTQDALFLNVSTRICNSSDEDLSALTRTIKENLNYTQVANVTNLDKINYTTFIPRLKLFVSNLKKYSIFRASLRDFAKMARFLPHNDCHNGYDDDDVISGNSTMNGTNNSGVLGAVKLWNALQKVICGSEKVIDEKAVAKPSGDSLNFDALGLTDNQMEHFRFMVRLFMSNPVVLYAPVNTSADRIIQKANSTLQLIDSLNDYARVLMNVTKSMHAYLRLNSTEKQLADLREIQNDMKNGSVVEELIGGAPVIEDFVSKAEEVPRTEELLEELDVTHNAACSWLDALNHTQLNVFRGFENETTLVDYFLTRAYWDNVTVFASVIFDVTDDSMPNHMVYTIRQNASYTTTTQGVRSLFWYPGPRSWDYSYYTFGYLWLQDTLERAMIDLYSEKDIIEPGSFVHQFPFPCYLRNNFLFIIEHVLPICLGISWVYSAATLVQSIVYEKEKRLKEVMRSMGLANSVHWLAWFITSYAQMTLTMTLLTVLLKAGEILAHSNPFVIWVMLEIFAASTITFAFLISTLYSKAKLAAACAGIIYLLSYVPFLFISIREESAHVIIPAWIKAIASLSSTTAFGLGAKYLAYYEMEGAGSQWHNLHYSPLEGDDFSLMHVLIMMVIDIIIYSSLVWYIEQVYPGEYGMPKPWYFPFVPSRWIEGGSGWCPERKANYVGSQDTDDDDILASSIRLRQPALPSESDPAHLPVGLEIDDLCKVYKKRSARKYAVDGLSLKLYQSQITAFLGHNGAGKTTTMNIITGLLSPTSGTARIYGQDIRSDMNQIRKSLGTCPQHNVLFDKLSVAEHLKFYARLKSLKQEDEIADELEQMIWNLGLPNKRDALVETLSGGMMRKLSVAIAFVGGSKTIILDEPTAGVDPHARRAIWDLILKYRKDRTVMLATHHMDEADIVGDRIAIIAQGRLRCVGSPLFLKARFGDGYRLTFVKTINADADDASAVDVDSAVGLDFSAGLTPGAHSNSRSNGSMISGFASRCNAFELGKFLHAFGPTPRLAMQSLHEVHFQLPNWSGQQLFKLFTEMEREDFAGKYHVQSYGLQDSTLEEIFLKIVSNEESDTLPRDANLNKKRTRSARRQLLNIDDSGLDSGASNRSSFHADRGESSPANSIHPAVDMTVPPFVPVVGWQLYGQQFAATFQKRFLCIRRNWKALFAQILLPALFVAVAMSVELPAVIMAPLPRMEMSPSQYYNFTQPKGNVIAYANHEHEDTIKRKRNDPTYVSGSSIAKTMYNPAGVGATCLLRYANESLVPTDAMNMTDRDWVRETLLDRYFIPTCRRVFVEGLQLVNFVPPTYVFEDPSQNSSVILKPTPAPDRYYPLCECSKDGTGFSCQSGGYKSAENRRLVTGDNLYDITGQNESEYYLFTSDIYRLRRYGSLTFGLQLDKVPSDFGENAPVSLRKIAVRHISK
uniref:ABC transporter domain-containing protein n=1 Tax=Plectus sambesii TaxID=2011161 RepID=A0A914W7B2_9BILA